MSHDPRDVASAVAAAFLDGEWTAAALAERGAAAAGVKPKSLTGIAAEVIAAYRDPPRDRRRELTYFVVENEVFRQLWRKQRRSRPHVAAYPLPIATAVRVRWPVPRLDTVHDLADWAELSVPMLDWFADVKSLERSASDRLRHYDHDWIYSRRGRARLLERPRPRIKALQRRLLHEVLDLVPVHDAAHGFVRHRDVVSFAAPHAGRAAVVRLDLEGFFASITAGRVFGVLRTIGYPEAVAHLLTGLVTTTTPQAVLRAMPQALRNEDLDSRRRMTARLARPHVPQGAPTSPALANLAGFRLDLRLHGLAITADASYTRYADDLAFSLDGPDAARRARRLVDAVRGVIRDEGFRVNDAKTAVVGVGQRQLLCGVVVNDVPGVQRRDRDDLRAILHNCRVSGPASQNHDAHPDFRAHLLGRIAWVAAVNNVQAQRLRRQFEQITW